MVTVSVYEEIQRCKQFGTSKTATARKLEVARGTVRRFWRMSENDFARYRKQALRRTQRFDRYRQEIIEILETNSADGQAVYVSSVYDVLEERHGVLPGSQRTLGNYIRMLREIGDVDTTNKKPMRRPQDEVEPGDQCQVDFGEYRIGSAIKVYIFVAVLAASRARYVCVQEHPFHTIEVIRHILSSFAFFGGRPRTLVIDQDKLMTVSENSGEIVHTKDFRYFLQEQDMKIWLCRKADPQSKGKVENAVKFVKTSFLSARRFESVEEIHAPLAKWLARRANGRISQATGRIPSVVLENEERPTLRALRSSVYNLSGRSLKESRKADAKGMISFVGNRYSVPDEYAEYTVTVAATPSHLLIHDQDSGKRIAFHRIPEGKGRNIVSTHHRAPRGKNAEAAYTELVSYHGSDEWRCFLDRNRDAYLRYWKEQTAVLRQFVASVNNQDALQEALTFCLESESYGAGDLQHAYRHLEESHKLAVQPLLKYVKPILTARRENPRPGVPRRSVGYYSSLISLLGGTL